MMRKLSRKSSPLLTFRYSLAYLKSKIDNFLYTITKCRSGNSEDATLTAGTILPLKDSAIIGWNSPLIHILILSQKMTLGEPMSTVAS